ncbi:MAG TPA: YraN family protein [Chromatiales bacterium]|nr:YraN family protein [Chromatiales bacterium]
MKGEAPTSTGRRAEALARDYLEARGLRLLTHNYRCLRGEIDLVMRDGATTVFVEVRYRRRDDFGTGADSVDARKRARLAASALHYLQRHREAARGPSRFDVVSMSGPPQAPQIRWIPNAFEV